jgi:hypothetical protein
MAQPAGALILPALEDRSSIQIALSQVLAALASEKLDPRRAGLFLYGLQIASQNVPEQVIFPGDTVKSTTQTSEGEELAPETEVCERPDDCVDCPKKDECNDYKPEDYDYDPDEDDSDSEDDEFEESGLDQLRRRLAPALLSLTTG